MQPVIGYLNRQTRRIAFAHAGCIPEAERNRFDRRFDGNRQNRSCRFCAQPVSGLQKGRLIGEQRRLLRLGIATV